MEETKGFHTIDFWVCVCTFGRTLCGEEHKCPRAGQLWKSWIVSHENLWCCSQWHERGGSLPSSQYLLLFPLDVSDLPLDIGRILLCTYITLKLYSSRSLLLTLTEASHLVELLLSTTPSFEVLALIPSRLILIILRVTWPCRIVLRILVAVWPGSSSPFSLKFKSVTK